MSTESETGINMPTSSPDYKKAVLSSEKDLAANTKNRRSLFGDTGKSWDLAKATMAMTLASLTDGALMDHYTRLSAELDMWHREAAKRTSERNVRNSARVRADVAADLAAGTVPAWLGSHMCTREPGKGLQTAHADRQPTAAQPAAQPPATRKKLPTSEITTERAIRRGLAQQREIFARVERGERMHCTYCHSSQPYPHTRKLGCPNHPACFLCGESHCGRVCAHNPHSEAVLKLKAENEARACAERRADKLAAMARQGVLVGVSG